MVERQGFWGVIVDAKGKVDFEKKENLIKVPEITLINSVLTAIPMSFYYLTEWVIKQIDRLGRAFFCLVLLQLLGVKCLRRWDDVYKSKDQGKFGVKNTRDPNTARNGFRKLLVIKMLIGFISLKLDFY